MCADSPAVHSLHTRLHPTHPSNSIVNFTDDMTAVGLIMGEDECAYRDKVEKLASWCSSNDLFLNTAKTKEIIVNFRRSTSNRHIH